MKATTDWVIPWEIISWSHLVDISIDYTNSAAYAMAILGKPYNQVETKYLLYMLCILEAVHSLITKSEYYYCKQLYIHFSTQFLILFKRKLEILKVENFVKNTQLCWVLRNKRELWRYVDYDIQKNPFPEYCNLFISYGIPLWFDISIQMFLGSIHVYLTNFNNTHLTFIKKYRFNPDNMHCGDDVRNS